MELQKKSFLKIWFTSARHRSRSEPLATEIDVNCEHRSNSARKRFWFIDVLQKCPTTNKLKEQISPSRINVCYKKSNNRQIGETTQKPQLHEFLLLLNSI